MEAIQAMCGVAFIVAVTEVAEIGDFSWFANPRQLMSYLALNGLAPFQRTLRRLGFELQ